MSAGVVEQQRRSSYKGSKVVGAVCQQEQIFGRGSSSAEQFVSRDSKAVRQFISNGNFPAEAVR